MTRAPFLFLILAWGVACAGGPRPETPDAASEPSLPAIAQGTLSPSASATAARLLARARSALEARAPADARSAARTVLEEYPRAPGSAEALWIDARASQALDEPEFAAEAARRFVEMLPPGHPLLGPALALQGRALLQGGRTRDAVSVLLRVPSAAPDSIRSSALESVRRGARRLALSDLEALLEGAAPGWDRLGAPIRSERALALYGRDRLAAAEAEARAVLELASDGPEAELARSILRGRVTVERRRSVVLGALLPRTGSPGQREYAARIREGIDVRLARADSGGALPVRLAIRDHDGRLENVEDAVRRLAGEGAAGIVGPLGEAALEAAVRGRSRPVPIVSPSAASTPGGAEAVYSLSAADPQGPRALARYAVDRRLLDAVIVHARTPSSSFEARAFTDEFQRLGGTVLRSLSYEAGATFFREPLQAAQELQPAALVLPIPADDVELLAPQVTYFGLDTLGIQLLGTAAWTDPAVLEAVQPRHTDGVVVATPRVPGRRSPAHERFVQAYEGTLQRTLRSPVPALGYDAAGLLLEAARRGAREPFELARALRSIQDFEGATGTLSIREGRIVRLHHLVRLLNREMIPIPMDFDLREDVP